MDLWTSHPGIRTAHAKALRWEDTVVGRPETGQGRGVWGPQVGTQVCAGVGGARAQRGLDLNLGTTRSIWSIYFKLSF